MNVEVAGFQILIYTFDLTIEYNPDSLMLHAVDSSRALVGVYEVGKDGHVFKALSDFIDVLIETRSENEN